MESEEEGQPRAMGTGQTKGNGAPRRALEGESPRRRREDAGRGASPIRASLTVGKEKKEEGFFYQKM
tara:strand:+ start:1110 stop:1310 length:201 start_codon:yes stop_codon:yes gene_type:complete